MPTPKFTKKVSKVKINLKPWILGIFLFEFFKKTSKFLLYKKTVLYNFTENLTKNFTEKKIVDFII